MSHAGALAPARRRRVIADGLFLLQLACASAFGIGQYFAMRRTVEGVSITWIGFWVAFLAVNLVLAVNAHRAHASRISYQTIVIYLMWTLVCGVTLILLLLADAARWNEVDTVTALIAGAGIAAAMVVGHWRGLGLADPMVRAAFAVFSKGVPQLTLAWNIWLHGGAGISTVAFTVGHVTICMRLWQVWLSIREAGWDRNRLGIAVGEIANEASWIVATVAWLLVG